MIHIPLPSGDLFEIIPILLQPFWRRVEPNVRPSYRYFVPYHLQNPPYFFDLDAQGLSVRGYPQIQQIEAQGMQNAQTTCQILKQIMPCDVPMSRSLSYTYLDWYNFTLVPERFFLGGGAVHVTVSCTARCDKWHNCNDGTNRPDEFHCSCRIHYALRDWFEDPWDSDKWGPHFGIYPTFYQRNPPGITWPYPIHEIWDDQYHIITPITVVPYQPAPSPNLPYGPPAP